jgi:hypothetical protein
MLQAFPREIFRISLISVKMVNMKRPFADVRDAVIMASTKVSNNTDDISEKFRIVAFTLVCVAVGLVILYAMKG